MYSGVRLERPVPAAPFDRPKDNVWSDECMTWADEEGFLCWGSLEGSGRFCGLNSGAPITSPEKATSFLHLFDLCGPKFRSSQVAPGWGSDSS